MSKTKIVPYRCHRHADGRSVSFFTSFVPDGFVLEVKGFTTENEDGTYGNGRRPFDTEAEGNAWLEKFPRFRGMHAMGS